MSADDVVRRMSQLIGVAQDGCEGFAEAAEYASDAELKRLFILCSAECAEAVEELKYAVHTLGREPQQQGSLAAAAHRNWVALKTRLENPNVAVLEEVERGEDHAEKTYAQVLATRLPPEVKQLVERHYQGVKKNHAAMKRLRDHYRKAA